MTAATGDVGPSGTGPAARVHRVARRYEPVIVALAVCLAVLHLVDPIPFQMPGVLGIAPFTAAPSGTVDPGPGAMPAVDEAAAPPAVPPGAVVIDEAPSAEPATRTGDADAVAAPPPAAVGSGPPPPPTTPGGGAATVFVRHPAPGGAGGVAVVGDRVVTSLADGGGLAVLGASGQLERTITLPNKGLAGVTNRDDREVLVAAANPSAVLAVDVATGASRRLAVIPDVPPCVPVLRETGCDAAPLDAPPRPWAVAEGPAGALFVVDPGQGAIWRVPGGGGPAAQWLADRTFVTPDGAAGPSGVAFDAERGELVIALPRRLTSTGGEVVAISITRTGTAGAQRTVATLADGDHPAGLALDRGSIFLSLPASRELLLLGRDGAERSRTKLAADLGAGDPTGISLIGDDGVLVALRRAGSDAATSVVRVDGVRSGP